MPGLANSGAAQGPTLPQLACACGRVTSTALAEPDPRAPRPAARAFENRIGWAYNARWRKPRAEVVADLRRMRDLGCNTVYIGHNSAGNTDPDAYEPGLVPAAWYAIAAGTPEADNARTIFQAVATTIDAAREVGLDVVLAIGYQIAMGDEWNAANPSELRLNRAGERLIHWSSVHTASPYSEVYRHDIAEYYAWVDAQLVRPNPHVVALNLADEPMGADFSPHAMAAFEARYGTPFGRATDLERGEFLAGVVADYAAWSAETWKVLNSDVRTMMTFHIQRDAPFLPDVERIFRLAPDTFIVSADTHLDDGLIERTITPEVIRLLYGMVRTLGVLSRVHKKPLMLWTSANAWGLKRATRLQDALLNLDIVHDTARQVGGQLGMLMAWGWNIHLQGVYDDAGNFLGDKEAMIAGVSQALADRREQLSRVTDGRPSRVVHVPSVPLFATIGARRFDHLAEGVVDLGGIDFANENVAYLTDGPALDEARRLGIPIRTL